VQDTDAFYRENKIQQLQIMDDEKSPVLESSSIAKGSEKINYSLSKKNSIQMEAVHKDEFEREERIKILRLCKDDMYHHLLKPYKYLRNTVFNRKEQKEVHTYQ
jgi:hypothetical protein